MTPAHKTDPLGPELTKVLHNARQLQEEIAKTHSGSNPKVTVTVTGTVGGGPGVSECTVVFVGDDKHNATDLSKGFLKQFPGAKCGAEKDKVVVCTV